MFLSWQIKSVGIIKPRCGETEQMPGERRVDPDGSDGARDSWESIVWVKGGKEKSAKTG